MKEVLKRLWTKKYKQGLLICGISLLLLTSCSSIEDKDRRGISSGYEATVDTQAHEETEMGSQELGNEDEQKQFDSGLESIPDSLEHENNGSGTPDIKESVPKTEDDSEESKEVLPTPDASASTPVSTETEEDGTSEEASKQTVKPKKAKPTPIPTKKVPMPTLEVKAAVPKDKEAIKPPYKEKNTTTNEYAKSILDLIITNDMKDVDKIRAVHDYIIINTVYDAKNLDAGTLPDSSFTIEGVLQEGVAVCQGYAETFQLFMELLEIESYFVEGVDRRTNVGHAWNMVKLDSDWYHVDTTWDDPIPDQGGRAQYKYFLVTDKVLAEDHSWERKNYPACNGTKYRYYIYEEMMIKSIDVFEAKFIKLYDNGQREITILYPEEGYPDMDFLKGYDYLFKTVDGKRIINYSWYPIWRLGDYTVLTVIME